MQHTLKKLDKIYDSFLKAEFYFSVQIFSDGSGTIFCQNPIGKSVEIRSHSFDDDVVANLQNFMLDFDHEKIYKDLEDLNEDEYWCEPKR